MNSRTSWARKRAHGCHPVWIVRLERVAITGSPLMVWTAPPPRLHSAEGPSPERHKEGDRYEKIHQNRD